MSNGRASPSPLAATVRILVLSTNSSRLPSGEKLGESPALTLCGTPPAVATTHTSLGIGPSGELLTLAGVSSQRFSPRVKAIDFVSGDQARSPILKPSCSVYGVIWSAFGAWEGSATQILRQPFASNAHATAEPVGAGTMSYGNGACITSLSVKAAGWGPAACVMNRPAQVAAALQSRNFPKPKSIMCLPLVTIQNLVSHAKTMRSIFWLNFLEGPKTNSEFGRKRRQIRGTKFPFPLADGAEITVRFSFFSRSAAITRHKLALFSGALLSVNCDHSSSR